MPKQSQKKSQSRSQSQSSSQSKNGGRGRKKRTMKKDRRVKKSRKVMMGGGVSVSNPKINEPISKNFDIEAVRQFLTVNSITVPDNLETATTYLDVRKLVSDKYDEDMLNNFKSQFNID